MRFVFLLLLLLMPMSGFAAPEVPVISFAQKVPLVVEAKKNPLILDLRIEQDKENVMVNAIVDRNTDRDQASQIAFNLIMLTKAMTLDDPPTDAKTPGKGLYNYIAHIARTDAVILAVGRKPAGEKDFTLDPPVMENLPPQFLPLTRRGDGKR